MDGLIPGYSDGWLSSSPSGASHEDVMTWKPQLYLQNDLLLFYEKSKCTLICFIIVYLLLSKLRVSATELTKNGSRVKGCMCPETRLRVRAPLSLAQLFPFATSPPTSHSVAPFLFNRDYLLLDTGTSTRVKWTSTRHRTVTM